MILSSHLNIIGDLTESFSIEIFRLNFWYVTSIAWNMTVSTMGDTLSLMINLVFGNESGIAWDDHFVFSLSYHFKFKEFIMGKLPC